MSIRKSERQGRRGTLAAALAGATDAGLDRVQIIKVWLEGDSYKEQIFDVAVSRGKGADSMTTVWQDPKFDPAKAAVYYARVLQIPTPRWSTLLAKSSGLPVPTDVAAMIQERAWSSPIWFTP